MRQIAQDGRGRQSLDHLADLCLCLLGARASGDQLAGAPVAAGRVPARDDEVAEAGKAGERLLLGARRLAEARHLGQSARDDRRLRVVAHTETVGASRGERDHVLRRGAELDADQVGVRVDAEGGRGDRLLEAERETFVLGRDHGRAGQAGGDLLRHVRPGEYGDRTVGDEGREPLAGRGIEALDEAEHRCAATDVVEHLAERSARHRDHDEVGLLVRRLVERGADGDGHVVPAPGQQVGERGSPRAAADDDDVHVRFLKSIATGTPSSSNRSRS